MAGKEKKARKAPKAKTETGGRKPTLAPFIREEIDIVASYKDKEFKATVKDTGMIRFDGEDFTSPSSAGKAAIKKSVDGWTFWKFKKDGEMVPLDVLRGHKSPLTKAAAA